jgi:hypothetical protein
MSQQAERDPRRGPEPVGEQESGSFAGAPQTPASGTAPDAAPQPPRAKEQRHPSPARENANETLEERRDRTPGRTPEE